MNCKDICKKCFKSLKLPFGLPLNFEKRWDEDGVACCSLYGVTSIDITLSDCIYNLEMTMLRAFSEGEIQLDKSSCNSCRELSRSGSSHQLFERRWDKHGVVFCPRTESYQSIYRKCPMKEVKKC